MLTSASVVEGRLSRRDLCNFPVEVLPGCVSEDVAVQREILFASSD